MSASGVTLSEQTLKVLPCPAHTNGHPNIVVTQLTGGSSSIAPERHHFNNSHSTTGLNNDKQESGHLESGRRISAHSDKTYNEAYELRLWKLVPPTFWPNLSDSTVQQTTSQILERHDASNALNRSEGIPTTPKSNRFFNLIEQQDGSDASTAETTSPPSPLHKRRFSDSSPSMNIKRQNRDIHGNSEELVVSPLLSTSADSRERNPFEIDTNQTVSNTNFIHRLYDSDPRRYSSQQPSKTSWEQMPTTPPRQRYRGVSLDPETSPIHSPTPYDRSKWKPLVESMSGEAGFNDNNESLHRQQVMDLSSPAGFSGVVNSINSPSNDRPNDYFGQGDNEAGQSTPTMDARRISSDLAFNQNSIHPETIDLRSPPQRRLSMSSILTRTPPSASRPQHQTHYRSFSFNELESPPTRTPTRSRRKGDQLHLPSDDSTGNGGPGSFLDSPSRIVQWSQSLETPVKNRSGANDPNITPKSTVIQRLRGYHSLGTIEDSASNVEGWSSLLETPPRGVTEDGGLNPAPRAFDGVLDRHRGNPGTNHIMAVNDKVPDSHSQGESFYSACSSIVNETEYQNNLKHSALDDGANIITQRRYSTNTNSTIEFDIKLDDEMDVNFFSQGVGVEGTLPSSLVHKLEQDSLEQDSLIMSSLDFQSQILPDSQSYDHEQSFDSGRENFGELGPLSQFPESDYNMEISEDPHGSHNSRQSKTIKPSTPTTNTFSPSNQFNSQRTNMIGDRATTPLESAIENNQKYDSDSQTMLQVQRSPELERNRESTEPPSEDDFGSIRFSQLDDVFNTTIEATQRPQKSPDLPRATLANNDANEATWLSRSASMLANLGDLSSNQIFDTSLSNHNSPMSMPSAGFATASGKEIAPISKALPSRVANLFKDDSNTEIEADSGYTSFSRSSETGSKDSPTPFLGFQTASKKSVLPISDSMKKKIAHLFDDEDMDLALGHPSDGFTSASSKPSYQADMPPSNSGTNTPSVFEAGGFMTGKGRKLAPVSKSALDQWTKKFTEDEDLKGTTERNLNTPKVLESPQVPHPQHRPQQKGFVGFQSGGGRALAPISKAAQDRALSFLELDSPPKETPAAPLKSFNQGFSNGAGVKTPRILNAITSEFVGPNVNKVIQKPAISNNMNNLKLKSIRSGSNVSGVLNQHNRAKAAFRSPLAFKSPLKKPTDDLNPKSGTSTITSLEGNRTNVDNLGLASTEQLNSRKQMNKRSTLHPNARLESIKPQTNAIQQPTKVNSETTSYKHLANIPSNKDTPKLRDVFKTPRQRDISELLDMGVPEDAAKMTLSSAKSFHFGNWGVERAYQDLISLGATPNLLSKVWLENHYRLIVWKLACYIRSWPETLLNASPSWFSSDSVMNQLAYRYEREINKAERPALRRIVEGDDSVARHMVLCVASISKEYSEESKQDKWNVTVTDGWYILPVELDGCLTRALMKGKIKVGSKLHICRAKLNGAENGVVILELSGAGADSSAVSISLQANCTRLARWDTKLGFQRIPVIWTKNIGSISPDGGLIPGLDVVVLRKYPVIYLETLEDGITKIKRTAREEDRAVEAYKEQIQKQYQSIIQQVEKEFEAEGGESNHVSFQERIQEKASEILRCDTATRNVVPFFIIRVGNYFSSERGSASAYSDTNAQKSRHEALVTFWLPDNGSYQEGCRIRLTSLMAKKHSRDIGPEEIQLVATRMTAVQEMPTDPETLLLTGYHPREITPCIDIYNLYQGAEIDIAVIVLAINMVTDFNKVYLIVADSSKQLILVEHQLSSIPSSSSSGYEQHLPTFLKIQSRLLIANVRFKVRDHKLGLDIVTTSQSYTNISAILPTQFSGQSNWPAYAQTSLQRLNEICNGTTGELLELMAEANVIIEKMRPSL